MTEEQSARTKMGDLSKEFFERKLEIDDLNDRLKSLNQQQTDIKTEMDEVMETEEMEKFSSAFGSHSRKVDVFPQIDEFEDFLNWIDKTGSHEFIQKRVNARPVRDMLENEGTLPPGISTFMKSTVNCRISPSGRKLLMSK